MRRLILSAFLSPRGQVLALVFGLLAMLWAVYLQTHSLTGGGFASSSPECVGIPPAYATFYGSVPAGSTCGFSTGTSDAIVGILFFMGLLATVFVAGRNLPRRFLSTGRLPRAWR